MVVVADMDNHALRNVDVMVPVESRDNNKARLVRVSTAAYDKDLGSASNQETVPRTTNASKSAVFDLEKTGKGGGRGTSWDGGMGGVAIMTNPSLLWQMSPEESTKDAKNRKNRCV
jgi:hypothetical protein